MSARDDSHGGRYEPARTTVRGEGVSLTGRCDQCNTNAAVRHPAKVLRGPLRGLRGMVCKACKGLREAVPA